MRKILFVLFMLFPVSSFSQESSPIPPCLDLGEKLTSARITDDELLVSSQIDVDYSSEFHITLNNKIFVLVIEYYWPCYVVLDALNDDKKKNSFSSKKLIESEDQDSGGRYWRNVKWEKPIKGRNWYGKIAYIDSIGDRVRLPFNEFAIIPKTLMPIFDVTIIKPEKITSQDIEFLLELIENILYVEQPIPDTTR